MGKDIKQKVDKLNTCTCNENNASMGLSCGCGHCHDEHNCTESIKNKRILREYLFDIVKIITSFTLFVITYLFVQKEIVSLILYILSALIVGHQLIIAFVKDAIKGDLFNENTLMFIASVAAFCIGYQTEGVLIILLFNLGELLENIATLSSKRKIAGLSKIRSTVVHLIDKHGVCDVEPESVKVGSVLEVKKGELVPIDCTLLAGVAMLDVKTVTGESKVYNAVVGNEIYSGSINLGDPIVVKTTKLYKDSTVERIISMVEGSISKKAKSQKFITSFAKVYTPIIAVLALLVSTVPAFFDDMNFYKWIYKGLSFLVISCPCALVISVPLAFFVGIGGLAKKGILVKGSNCIELLANTEVVVFDKTGTLTKGNLKVSRVLIENGFSADEIKAYALSVEEKSNHPISVAIVEEFKGGKRYSVDSLKEIVGLGLTSSIENKNISVGNLRLMEMVGVEIKEEIEETVVYVSVNNKLAGRIYFEDEIKHNARQAILSLKKVGVKNCFMLSGDKKLISEKVGRELELDAVYFEQLPEQKVDRIKEIKSNSYGKVVYCGDGINDTPSLATADVGISMGKLGSEIAVDSSDVVILDDNLEKLSVIIKHSKKIRSTVIQNIVGSLFVKFFIMLLSIFITLPIFVSMLADVGVMLLAVLNSLKNSKVK
ncbi:MAG: cadmium-translocating P-type ATPase [Clostridiales bacterium]|nr:cadmium-translocating P-type ATPase [Clostridiales bacterium]